MSCCYCWCWRSGADAIASAGVCCSSRWCSRGSPLGQLAHEKTSGQLEALWGVSLCYLHNIFHVFEVMAQGSVIWSYAGRGGCHVWPTASSSSSSSSQATEHFSSKFDPLWISSNQAIILFVADPISFSLKHKINEKRLWHFNLIVCVKSTFASVFSDNLGTSPPAVD